MEPQTPNKDIYWLSNGKKFYHKLDAWDHTDCLIEPTFYHFDKEYDAYDWNIEPSESFNTLCKYRAEQLRDQYDYLRFWYSGGSDSHTALLAFVENNVHIDEIVVWRMSPSDNFEGGGNAESNEIALPYIKQLDLSKTKITILDLGEAYYQWFYNHENWTRLTTNYEFRPNNLNTIYEWNNDLFRDDTFCDIIGGEKPKINIDENSTMFWDSNRDYQLGSYFVEDFFITPNLIDLHCKQSHLALQALQQYDAKSKKYFGSFRTLYKQNESLGKSWDIYTPKCVFAIEEATVKLLDKYFSGLEIEGRYNKHRFNKEDIKHKIRGTSTKLYRMK